MEIMPELKARGVIVWVHGRDGDVLPAVVSHFDTAQYSDEPVPREIRQAMTMKDVCSYIFTSGTTGENRSAPQSKNEEVCASIEQYLGTRAKIGLNFLGPASTWPQVHTSRLASKVAAGRIMS